MLIFHANPFQKVIHGMSDACESINEINKKDNELDSME